MFDTRTPRTADIIEDARLKARLSELGRRQQETAKLLGDQHLTKEQVEAERFAVVSNILASDNARYAAARSASANFLVLPLEPNGTRPLVDPSEATNDPYKIYDWWSSPEFKRSNVGVLLGRIGGIFGLRIEDMAAYGRLRAMATVDCKDEDDRTWKEYRELGGYSVRLVAPSKPFVSRSAIGWGKAVNAMLREDGPRDPETFFLVWSFPNVATGQDAFEYRSRKVGTGLFLMGENEVMPWAGSVLEGGVQIVGPSSKPPDVPLWLANTLGKPRSRKAMAAAREVYEALQRRDSAHVAAALAARRVYEEQEREQALRDREQAEKILAEVMAKES